MKPSVTDLSVLGTAGVVVISATYEWCYFLVVGVDFISFLSAGDLLPLVLAWLPRVLGSWFVLGLAYALLYNRRPERETAVDPNREAVHQQRESSERRSRSARALRWALFSLVGVAVIVPAFNVLFSPSGSYVTLLLSALFGTSVLYSHRMIGLPVVRELHRWKRLAVSVFPLCLMMFGYLAALEAQEDLDAEEGQYFLIAQENESEMGGCVVLRSLAGGVLVRVPTENQIQFVPWASIKRVERRAESPTGTRACRWWGVACSDTVGTKTSTGS